MVREEWEVHACHLVRRLALPLRALAPSGLRITSASRRFERKCNCLAEPFSSPSVPLPPGPSNHRTVERSNRRPLSCGNPLAPPSLRRYSRLRRAGHSMVVNEHQIVEFWGAASIERHFQPAILEGADPSYIVRRVLPPKAL